VLGGPVTFHESRAMNRENAEKKRKKEKKNDDSF
jgi:hypothetical protein